MTLINIFMFVIKGHFGEKLKSIFFSQMYSYLLNREYFGHIMF